MCSSFQLKRMRHLRRFTPSAASRLINAQSSKMITLQSSSVHFSPPKLSRFQPPPTPSHEGANRKEVLSARSAKVAAVSGATYTSEAYLSSLEGALDRAQG